MNEFLNDPAIVGEFIAESREHLESLEPRLLQLEENPEDSELLNSIFRTFHTIKGSSSFLGLIQLTETSHRLETVLDDLRKGKIKVTSEIIDLLFKGMDILKGFIEDIASGEEERINRICSYNLKEIQEFINKVEEVIHPEGTKHIKEEKGVAKESSKYSEEEKQIFLTAAEQHLTTIRECLEGLEKNSSDFHLIDAFFRAVHSLKSSSNYMKLSRIEILTKEQERVLQKIREEKRPISVELLNALKSGYEFLLQLINDFKENKESPFDLEKSIEQIKKAFESDGETSQKSSKRILPKREFVDKTIRVPESKLDSLMNLVGELVINRSSFYSILQKLENGKDPSKIKKEIKQAAQTMRRITTELQMTVTELHMLPIKSLFGKFPRLVRDLSREKSKKIELELSGEETQLDKMMIEKISDPLVHLIRNAIDHGIEFPEEREAKGKPSHGTIKLSASQEGEVVVIKISDDGRGMDPEVLKETAIKKGIITPERAKILSKRECLELIFLPGFSTAAKVTDLSGRGVGMDVVRNTIKELKGEVDIDTEPDRGTTFAIRLPLTLAIVNVLLIEAGGQMFALPLSSIKETVKIPGERIKKVFERKITLLREEILGIVDLRKLLKISTARDFQGLVPVVIVHGGGKNLGLIVDALHQQEEIVIKPLEGIVADIPGIAGATVLGDGKVIPILDPTELIQMAIR
ncbi:chemotaxis protein CheA [Candidatus Aerophobetes bacterium]|nr:chemotaxis protein CheA [Candidatus Aerophobetes bacterium]